LNITIYPDYCVDISDGRNSINTGNNSNITSSISTSSIMANHHGLRL